MRNVVLLLAGVALTLIAVVACTARDDAGADTSGEDTARADGSVRDTLSETDPRAGDENVVPPALPSSRAADRPRDTAIPTHDSIRATRPKLPGVVPDSKPGRWRGIKLPEKRPVTPIESIRAIEPAPDSIMKGDSTRPRPPRLDR
jgi:hypothetical protein